MLNATDLTHSYKYTTYVETIIYEGLHCLAYLTNNLHKFHRPIFLHLHSIVDKEGTPIVVTTTTYLSPGKGVIIGDTVAIAEPYFSPIDIEPQGSQYKFSMVRVRA